MKLYVSEESKQSIHMAALSGIYWFVAAIGCYQTLYLQNIGFTASSLGVLNAAGRLYDFLFSDALCEKRIRQCPVALLYSLSHLRAVSESRGYFP